MPLYPQLLLSRGGGIINDSAKAKQSGGSTLAIGLGGTGIDCLKVYKKAVFNRILPDNDSKSQVPEYSHIKFLAIDTDDSSIVSDDEDVVGDFAAIDKYSEFFDISSPNIGEVIYASDVLSRRKDMKWLSHSAENGKNRLTIEDAEAGAGGVRQVGRFLAIEKATELENKIKILIASAGVEAEKGLNIHIFAGIGGGTGSGTFLDVCYIIRKVLKENPVVGSVEICGYLFLPDVNLSKTEISANPLLSKKIQINGFAALKEIDYCMNFERNGDKWEQYYGDEFFTTNLPPVKLCHLVSAKTASGFVPGNAYDYALNVVSDYAIEYTADAGGNFGLKSHRSNVDDQIKFISGDTGALYKYCILGASNAIIPFREITTYLATKLFAEFSSIYEVTPSLQAATDFANAVGLSHKQLFSEYTKGANIDGYRGIAAGLPLATLKTTMDPLINAFNKYDDKILGQQASNGSSMTHALNKDYNPEQASNESVSVISKIFSQLHHTCICNPSTGPFYAYNMINASNGKNLLDIMTGIITENNEKYKYELQCETEWDEKSDLAKVTYQNKSNKRNTNAYIEALTNYYIHRGHKIAYQRFGGVLTTIKNFIDELARKYYSPLCSVLTNLKDTFAENAASISLMINKGMGKYEYIKPIMSIAELKESMDKELEKIDPKSAIGKMLTEMVNSPEVWLTGDSFKISRFVNVFMTKEMFKDYANKSILDFLQMKYGTEDKELISKKIQDDTIAKLGEKGDPLFMKTPAFKLTDTSTIEYISVPADTSVIVEAANSYQVKKGGSLSVRNSHLNDRISFMKFYCGVPMYAYQGLSVYETPYSTTLKPGTHLYERGERDKIWDEYLPSPIPASYTIPGKIIEKVEKYKSDSFELLEKCIKAKTISEDSDGIRIFECDYDELKEKLNRVKALYDRNRTEDAEMLFSSVKEVKDSGNFKHSQVHLIAGSNKGLHIARDKFVSFPKDRDIASEEFKKYEEFMKLYNETEKLFASKEDYPTFRDAYFVGLIKFKPLYNVKLEVKDEFGFVMEEEILCDPNMVHKTVPIYQAYLTFKQLPDEIKSTVKSKCAEYIEFSNDNMNQQVLDNIDVVSAKFNETYITAIQEAARNLPNPREATMFIQKFISEFKAFEKQIKSSF